MAYEELHAKCAQPSVDLAAAQGVGTDGCTVETVVSNGPEVRSMIRR